MIIKSMSRKEPSFGQLIEYMSSDIDKADQRYTIHQNLFSRKAEKVEQEFLHNAALMKKRKNGNYLYHEILSITKAHQLAAILQFLLFSDRLLARIFCQVCIQAFTVLIPLPVSRLGLFPKLVGYAIDERVKITLKHQLTITKFTPVRQLPTDLSNT